MEKIFDPAYCRYVAVPLDKFQTILNALPDAEAESVKQESTPILGYTFYTPEDISTQIDVWEEVEEKILGEQKRAHVIRTLCTFLNYSYRGMDSAGTEIRWYLHDQVREIIEAEYGSD